MQIAAALNHFERTWTYQPKVVLISHSRAVRKEGQGRGHGNSKLSWDQKVLVRALCGLLCGLVQDDLAPSGHFLGFAPSLFTLCAVAACPLGCGQDGSHRVRVFRPWRIRSLPSGLWPRWPVRHSNQNTTFDHEHGAPDRDFFNPLSIKTQLFATSMPDRDLFIPLSIKMQLLNTSMGL